MLASLRKFSATALIAVVAGLPSAGLAQINSPPDAPWADDRAVQAVLALRRAGIEAMVAGRMSAETERYSSTFTANTPGGVVPGDRLLRMFLTGNLRYVQVEQNIEYAGSHGPDVVVLMGEEVVVAGEGAPNAGQRVRRRFTDVFRRENGEWRHDLRHANVIETEAP